MPFEFLLENPEIGEEFPVPIKGVIDLIEEDDNGTLWVVDHKTSSRAFSDHQIDADFQLMIYAAAVEQLDLSISSDEISFPLGTTAAGAPHQMRSISYASKAESALTI